MKTLFRTRIAARRAPGWAVARSAVVWLAVALAAAPAAAQEGTGLAFVAGLAYEDGGPGAALVTGLRAIGMDGTRPGACYVTVCVDPVVHPFYFDEGLNLSVFLGVRYRFHAPVSIDALFSNGQRGHAEGYDDDTFDHVIIRYSTFIFSTSLGAHAGPIRLAAGPVLKTTGWKSTLNATRDSSDRTFAMGGMVNASAGVRFSEAWIRQKL